MTRKQVFLWQKNIASDNMDLIDNNVFRSISFILVRFIRRRSDDFQFLSCDLVDIRQLRRLNWFITVKPQLAELANCSNSFVIIVAAAVLF